MAGRQFLVACVAATLALVLLDVVSFPILFPFGLAERFANPRPMELLEVRALGFVASGMLLASVLYTSRVRTARDGLALGALLGLLVSLPLHLDLFAQTTASAQAQFLPVLWTTLSWAVTSALCGRIFGGWALRVKQPAAAVA